MIVSPQTDWCNQHSSLDTSKQTSFISVNVHTHTHSPPQLYYINVSLTYLKRLSSQQPMRCQRVAKHQPINAFQLSESTNRNPAGYKICRKQNFVPRDTERLALSVEGSLDVRHNVYSIDKMVIEVTGN